MPTGFLFHLCQCLPPGRRETSAWASFSLYSAGGHPFATECGPGDFGYRSPSVAVVEGQEALGLLVLQLGAMPTLAGAAGQASQVWSEDGVPH